MSFDTNFMKYKDPNLVHFIWLTRIGLNETAKSFNKFGQTLYWFK